MPDKDRITYFKEQLMMGWYELLCCPSAMGSIITQFKQDDPSGGQAQYKIKLRLSHSEHVPRYQLHVVSNGKTRQWIVGHMEKTETHLRAKPDEFLRVQVWKITCNSWVYEKRRSALHRKSHFCFSAVKERPTPTASKMQQIGMTIATQAKCRKKKNDSGQRDDRESVEEWVQTIGTHDKSYKLSVQPPDQERYHRELEDIKVLRILYQGKKVCVARKQRFAGTLGKVCQPYLGVQIRPSKMEKKVEAAEDLMDSEKNEHKAHPEEGQSLLDTHELMYLLMCLAWSEETMSPTADRTDQFIDAMRKKPGEQMSADWQGLSVQWDTDDVRERLKHVNYAAIHSWDQDARGQDEEEEEDPPPEQYADKDAGAGVGPLPPDGPPPVDESMV